MLTPPTQLPLPALASGSLGSQHQRSFALGRWNACKGRSVSRRQEGLERLLRSGSAGPRACARTVHSPPQSCASVAWIFRPSSLRRARASLLRVRANESNRHRTSDLPFQSPNLLARLGDSERRGETCRSLPRRGVLMCCGYVYFPRARSMPWGRAIVSAPVDRGFVARMHSCRRGSSRF